MAVITMVTVHCSLYTVFVSDLVICNPWVD